MRIKAHKIKLTIHSIPRSIHEANNPLHEMARRVLTLNASPLEKRFHHQIFASVVFTLCVNHTRANKILAAFYSEINRDGDGMDVGGE